MRTRGLALVLPPHSVEPGSGHEPVRGVRPGDFLLSRAHGRKHAMIRWGQSRRIPAGDRAYAEYTHAALVVSADGRLIEAIGEGVRENRLKQYVIDNEVFQVVRVEASEESRRQVVDFAEKALSRAAPYASLATVSIFFWAVLDWRLLFFMDGSYTCSGLVARALERMGANFEPLNPAKITPAQLAVFFGAPPSP